MSLFVRVLQYNCFAKKFGRLFLVLYIYYTIIKNLFIISNPLQLINEAFLSPKDFFTVYLVALSPFLSKSFKLIKGKAEKLNNNSDVNIYIRQY